MAKKTPSRKREKERLRDKFALTALRNGCGVDLYDMLNKGETDDIGILMYRVADSCMKAREK